MRLFVINDLALSAVGEPCLVRQGRTNNACHGIDAPVHTWKKPQQQSNSNGWTNDDRCKRNFLRFLHPYDSLMSSTWSIAQ